MPKYCPNCDCILSVSGCQACGWKHGDPHSRNEEVNPFKEGREYGGHTGYKYDRGPEAKHSALSLTDSGAKSEESEGVVEPEQQAPEAPETPVAPETPADPDPSPEDIDAELKKIAGATE